MSEDCKISFLKRYSFEYSFTQYYKKGSRKFETYLEPLTSLFFFFFLRTYPYLEGSFTIILSIYLLTIYSL